MGALWRVRTLAAIAVAHAGFATHLAATNGGSPASASPASVRTRENEYANIGWLHQAVGPLLEQLVQRRILVALFITELLNQSFCGSGGSSHLVVQFPRRELPTRNSVVVWSRQLPPEEDAPCCSIRASVIAERGIVMAYVPIGVSMPLRKYLSPACSKLSCACPI